ncbi:flotillin-1-like isoform X2 [Convolutriloba macropyga]|uniref:flotillin-1-like isoform X2 n=1 Tax=Convolutriloba macropyga TaxID=536237 RepID=UPI003F523E0A
MFRTCGPNEAMVVSGCFHRRPLLVPGGRVLFIPALQTLQRLSLNTMTFQVETGNVYTKKGVEISVTGIAQLKIDGQNEEMLAKACQQFLGKREREIHAIALQTLSGHQRAIMGNLTVEEIYQDRESFNKQVFETASADLASMGMVVISYTIHEIHDGVGYLKALGKSRTEEVRRDARIGEAQAKMESGIKEAEATQEKEQARYFNEEKMAESKRTYEIEQAKYNEKIYIQQAQADLAYDLQAAIQRQKIVAEETKIKEIERAQQIAIQEQEILRRQKELNAKVKQPALAEKYKKEQLAIGQATMIQNEAEAESMAIKLKGEAEASAVNAKAKAEAEQMALKAQAWQQYQDAALVDMVLQALPQMVAEVASPLTEGTKGIKLVATGSDAQVGAAKLTGEVLDIVERLPNVVNNMTGVDLSKAISKR